MPYSDDDINKLIYGPTGERPEPKADDGDGESSIGTAADVGRGLTKSAAGTAVAIPRLGNQLIGLIPRYGTRMRNTLGELAESVPGVKQVEDFVDSPNRNWAESAGYWGGEGLQLLGGGLIGEGAKALEGVEAASKVGKTAETAEAVGGPVFRVKPELKALPKPAEKPFSATPAGPKSIEERMADAQRSYRSGEEAAQSGDKAAAAVRNSGRPWPERSWRVMSEAEQQAAEAAERNSRLGAIRQLYPDRQSLLRTIGKGAARGALGGAITDPQDPLAGAVTGGTLGLGGSSLGALARSQAGQYIAGLISRGVAAEGVFRAAQAAGIPRWFVMTIGAPFWFRHWGSPWGRAIDRFGRRVAGRLGGVEVDSAGRVTGRVAKSSGAPVRAIGGAGGTAANWVEQQVYGDNNEGNQN